MQPIFPAILNGGTSVNGVYGAPSGFVMEKGNTAPTELSTVSADIRRRPWAVLLGHSSVMVGDGRPGRLCWRYAECEIAVFLA
jgi:hypothetical protein